jgi:hypothetical protein
MAEVMDLGNAYLMDYNITSRQETSSSSKKAMKPWSKSKKKSSKWEEYSGIAMGSKTQKSISSLVI